VDANIVVQTALNITDNLEAFWDRVDREQITPCAPRLWLSETASAIRFLYSHKEILSDEAGEL
jgi:hypothetical protein